jgi:hypothetical protein
MSPVSVPCGVCPQDIGLGAAVCPGCGREVNDQDRAVLQVRLEGSNFAAHDRGRHMRQASTWIGVLAILFAVSAPIVYAMQDAEAEKALAQLDRFDDGAELQPIDGKVYTAGELRKQVAREPLQALITNLVLAGLMGVLWLWARRAPLPAIGCALALFIVVEVASAVVDPTTIYKGIIVKVIAVGALVKGLRAALAARAAMQRPAP